MESRVIVFSVLMLAACAPANDIEPVKEPVIEQPVEAVKPVPKPVIKEPKEDKKAVKKPVATWDCRVTNNKVVNEWKREYRCNGKLDGE